MQQHPVTPPIFQPKAYLISCRPETKNKIKKYLELLGRSPPNLAFTSHHQTAKMVKRKVAALEKIDADLYVLLIDSQAFSN